MTTIVRTLQSEMKRTRSTPTMSSTNDKRRLYSHINEPWLGLEITNFLSPERWKVIRDLADIQLEKYYEWLEAPKKVYFNKANASRDKYNCYVDEDIIPETNELFKEFDFPVRPYEGELKKVIHWAIAPPNWSYPAHCDNRARISTTIFYVGPEKSDGTVLCKNPSSNDKGDHEAADKPDLYTKEIQWEPNKAFFHNPIPNETWHSIKNTTNEPRITLNTFLVQENLVAKGRCYTGHEITI